MVTALLSCICWLIPCPRAQLLKLGYDLIGDKFGNCRSFLKVGQLKINSESNHNESEVYLAGLTHHTLQYQ